MEEAVLYPVCPYRNVPAAFARFRAPDAGGVERFFIDEHARFLDSLHALALSACLTGRLCGARLARQWNQWATHPQLPLLLGAPPIPALRAWVSARDALTRSAGCALALRRCCARAAQALGCWAAHRQPSLFLGPQPVALAML